MKKLKILLIILGSIAIIAGVVCAIVFSLPKGSGDPNGNDGTELLINAPINNDTWTTSGNYATKIDGKNISGRGVMSDPYKVYTPEGLAYFAHVSNEGNYISSSTYIEIMNDLDLSAHYWVPISAKNINNQSIFMGNLNGNGHKIYGMFISQQFSDMEYSGLIGFASTGATIENLTIVTGKISNGINVISSGAVVGKLEYGTLKNVHNYINIEENVSGRIGIGGIVGDITSSKIINCSNQGNIINHSANMDKYSTGGLVGSARGDNEIRGSYNFGTLEAYYLAGGLVGEIDKNNNLSGTTLIVDCFNLGNLQTIGIASGLVGRTYDSLTINQCYNGGDLKGHSAYGVAYGTYTQNTSIKLTDVLNFGEFDYSSEVGRAYGLLAVMNDEGATGNTLFKNCYFSNADLEASTLATTGATKKANLRQEILGQTFLTENENWSMTNAWSHFKISEAFYPIPLNNVPDIWEYYAVKFIGDGSEKNPYKIASAGNLAYLSGLSKVNNEAFAGKYFVMTDNIDLSAHEWTPIAQENAFAGYFNGGNYEIKNMKMFARTSYSGLFAKLGKADNVSALVQNVKLKNVSIIGQDIVGGLSGLNDGGKISNCQVDGKLVAKEIAGGFVGKQNAGKIENSYSNIQILSVSGKNLGGLVGEADSVDILTSEANAYIKSNGNTIGGLVGSANSVKIDKSFANVNLIGQESIGGLAGELTGESTISSSVVKGKIYTYAKNKIAGLVGSASANTALNKNVIFISIQVSNKIGINIGEVYGGETVASSLEGTYADIILLDENGNRIGKEIKKIYVTESTNQEEVFKDYFAFDKIDNFPAPAGVIGQGTTQNKVDVLKILIDNGFDMVKISA